MKRIERIVYCIIKKVPDVNYDMYVGSTCLSLSVRLSKHKYKSSLQHAKNIKLYKRMREVGLGNWIIKPLFVYTCGKDEIRRYEKKYCEILQPDLNTYSPLRTVDEKKEYKKKYNVEYRQNNKEVIRQKKAEYHQENKKSKKYYCNICDKAFHHKGTLNRHKRTLKHQFAFFNSLD